MRRRVQQRPTIRRIIGWSVLALGIVGVVIPILPGFPFVVLAVFLIGPHDPLLRRFGILIHLLLRRWSQAKHPKMRQVGMYIRNLYYEKRLLLREHLHQREYGGQTWRGHYLLLALTLFALAISASIGFILWHTIL